MSDAGAATAAVTRLGLLQLVAVKGASAGERFDATVPAQPVNMGRKPSNDFVLKDDTVSREHAVIQPTPEGWRITARKHDVFLVVAGQPVPDEGALLADGDEIQLGLAVVRVTITPVVDEDDADRTVVFGVEAAPGAPPPPPRPTAVPRADAGAEPHPPVATAREEPRAQELRHEPAVAPARRAEPAAADEAPAVATPRRPDVAPEEPPRRAPRQETPRERVGRFDVFATLHDSDASRLERAADVRNGAAVTLCRLRGPQLGFFARRRFLKAVDRLRGITHENLLAPHAAERADAELLLVYPPVTGVGASVVLRQGRRDLPIDLAVWIARQVARGLAHAERVGGSDLRLAVSDGEVVCGRDGDVVLLLAPPVPVPPAGDRYGAPEEHAGGAAGVRAAIFSLGVLLWELLAREAVVPGQQTMLRSVHTVRIEVPQTLTVVTMRALELRPEDRFGHATELAEALEEELERLAPGYGPEAAARWLREHVPDEEGEAW